MWALLRANPVWAELGGAGAAGLLPGAQGGARRQAGRTQAAARRPAGRRRLLEASWLSAPRLWRPRLAAWPQVPLTQHRAALSRRGQAGVDILVFCACGAVGQLFIFHTIKTFGSLANTIITTTRKFFNILLSVVWSGNPLLPRQWVAVALVFIGLAVSSIVKSRRHRHPPLKHA